MIYDYNLYFLKIHLNEKLFFISDKQLKIESYLNLNHGFLYSCSNSNTFKKNIFNYSIFTFFLNKFQIPNKSIHSLNLSFDLIFKSIHYGLCSIEEVEHFIYNSNKSTQGILINYPTRLILPFFNSNELYFQYFSDYLSKEFFFKLNINTNTEIDYYFKLMMLSHLLPIEFNN